MQGFASGFLPTPPHDDAVASGSELAPPLPPGDFHPQAIAPAGRTQGGAAARRRWPGVSAGLSLAEARPAHAGPHAGGTRRSRWLMSCRPGRGAAVFRGNQLSSSRPPRQWRPSGPSLACDRLRRPLTRRPLARSRRLPGRRGDARNSLSVAVTPPRGSGTLRHDMPQLSAGGTWGLAVLGWGVDEAVHGHAEVGAGADRAGAAAVEPDDFGVARQLRVERGR